MTTTAPATRQRHAVGALEAGRVHPYDPQLQLPRTTRMQPTPNQLAGLSAAPSFPQEAGRKDQRSAASVASICALAAMGSLATNIFLPSLPTMAADLGVSSAVVTSTISIFFAIFAVGQLIVGPLADRFGRRISVLAGLCIFVLGTAWCAFAGDLSNLLIGRSIQACGVCTATVLSRAIASDLFDGQALAKVMAWITVATAAAPGFSPLLGSALDHFFGWRSEFAFVATFAICTLLAYATLIGETHRSTAGTVNPLAVGRAYLGLIRNA